MKIRAQVLIFSLALPVIGILPLYSQTNIDTHASAIRQGALYSWTSDIHYFEVEYAPENQADDSVAFALLHSDNNFFRKAGHLKALFNFLRSSGPKKEYRNKRIAQKLYIRLAKVFARMKIYPLAMQCYSNILLSPQYNSLQEDSLENDATDLPLSANEDVDSSGLENKVNMFSPVENSFPVLNYKFDPSLLNNFISSDYIESDPVSADEITASFDERKKSFAYAIILHVKQPRTGSRKAFTGLDNVGHTFITLIKYNTDSTSESRSFGFYPQKDNLLSATPLIPVSTSVFKDDAYHEWDESIGKFISHKRFKKIIRLITRYNKRNYNLSNNNCSDFGLVAAAVAGIQIENTRGSWPLGSGNNPANAGQSIFEGKFFNVDTQNKNYLFVCTGP